MDQVLIALRQREGAAGGPGVRLWRMGGLVPDVGCWLAEGGAPATSPESPQVL